MLKVKRWIPGTLVLSLVLAAAVAGSASAANRTVTVAAHFPEAVEDYTRLFNRFEELHPDIDVDFQLIPWQGSAAYWERVLTLFIANELPDILIIPYVDIKHAMETGIYTDITHLVERDSAEFQPEDYIPPFHEMVQLNGRWYGVPYLGAYSLWVNYSPQAFLEAGLATPIEMVDGGEWSLDTLFRSAERITRLAADGSVIKRGMVGMNVFSEGIAQWMWANGARVMDGNRLMLDEYESIEIMERLKAAQDSGVIGWWLDPEAGMVIWWDGVVTWMQYFMGVSPGQFDQVPFPPRDGVEPANLTVLSIAGMTRNVRDVEAAWEVLKYLSKEGEELMLDMVHGGVPTRRSAVPTFIDVRHRYGIEGARFYGTPAAAIRPGYQLPTEIQNIINTEIWAFLDGQKSAPQALGEASNHANAILEARYSGTN